MANPPPVRPWFRLASIRSAPGSAPAPAPAQESRPILPLPAFRTASAPSSPQTQPQEKSVPSPSNSTQTHKLSTSLPTSPIQKATVTSPEKSARVPSPTQSPKTIKQANRSPKQSPNNKPTAPPPSPLNLPPSQLKIQPDIPTEAEPKTVLVQKTIDKPKPWQHNGTGELHRETKHHSNAHHGKHDGESKEKGVHKKVSDSEESGMRVITIAGENRGAYMELIQSPKKQEAKYLHKKGNSNINVDGIESDQGSGSEEGNIRKKDKNHKGRTTFPMAAYMNSNVQCVNNSLLYHTSCSHHDPGVRLSLSKKPFGEGYHVDGHTT